MKNLKPYANFLFEVGVLSRTPRTGFRHLGGWRQSIAEHLCRTAYIGFVLAHLAEENGQKLDIRKVLENCLFHDLGEARATDLDYISQKYSQSDELKAIQDAVKGLSFAKRVTDSFIETEGRTTPEGIIAKDADSLEFLCSVREIMDDGNVRTEDFIPGVLKRLRTPEAKRLAKEILKTNSNEWWFQNKDDDHWVNGGKKQYGK
jgi:putative hydrolases of HD superfamily